MSWGQFPCDSTSTPLLKISMFSYFFFFQEHFPVRFWYISIIYLTTRCNRLTCIAFPYHYILQLLHRIMPLLYYEVATHFCAAIVSGSDCIVYCIMIVSCSHCIVYCGLYLVPTWQPCHQLDSCNTFRSLSGETQIQIQIQIFSIS